MRVVREAGPKEREKSAGSEWRSFHQKPSVYVHDPKKPRLKSEQRAARQAFIEKILNPVPDRETADKRQKRETILADFNQKSFMEKIGLGNK